MPTILKTKNSVTTTVVPTTLQQGELAVNITDKKVWVGNAATTPVQLLGDGGSASFTSIAFGAGTVSAPSITFTGDTNTGIYSPAADTIAFTEGGVESMRITSAGDVGIGTTSPVSKLDVVETATIKRVTSANFMDLNFYNAATAGVGVVAKIRCDGDGLSNEVGALAFHTGSLPSSVVERMRITSAGNVGIGTSSPATRLVIGGSTGNYGLQIAARTDFTGLSGQLLITDSSGSVCFSTSSGSLSIGLGATVGTNAGTERVKLPIAGGLQVVNSVSVGNATPTTSGAGITFPATQSASSDANTLDDYEEGTWTPTLDTVNGNLANFGYSARSGTYTKIGRIVTITCEIGTVNAASVSGTGGLHITGLPFGVADSAGAGRNTLALTHDARWTNNPSFGQSQGNPNAIKLFRNSAMNTGAQVNVSDMTATNTANFNLVTINFTYQT